MSYGVKVLASLEKLESSSFDFLRRLVILLLQVLISTILAWITSLEETTKYTS